MKDILIWLIIRRSKDGGYVIEEETLSPWDGIRHSYTTTLGSDFELTDYLASFDYHNSDIQIVDLRDKEK